MCFCFFLPRDGFCSGICTWRFAAVFLVNHFGLFTKICWPREGATMLANIIFVFVSSAALALFSLHQALGSWGNVAKIATRYPALVVLPIVGFFTFGPTKRALPQDISGVALNWNLTFANMAASFFFTSGFGFLELTRPHLWGLHMWLTDYSGCHPSISRGCTYLSYVYETDLKKARSFGIKSN